MATVETYRACVERSKQLNRRDFHTGALVPDLKDLFGVVSLINKRKLKRCSKAEYSRHLKEDRLLRFLYLEN